MQNTLYASVSDLTDIQVKAIGEKYGDMSGHIDKQAFNTAMAEATQGARVCDEFYVGFVDDFQRRLRRLLKSDAATAPAAT